MADEVKQKELFNVKGHSVKTIKETFNGHTIDALFTESDGKVEAYISVEGSSEGEDMHAQHYKEFLGNGVPAREKAMAYYNDIKKLYSKK